MPRSPAAGTCGIALWGGVECTINRVGDAWFSQLQRNGHLLRPHDLDAFAALGLSAAAGVLLIGLWRSWPLWHGLEREGGSLAAHWRALSERDFHAWHGLGVAALVAIVIGVGGTLAWPGLLRRLDRIDPSYKD